MTSAIVVVLPGIGDGLPDDLLMAEMHAVEEPDGQADLAAAGFSSLAAVNDLHLNGEVYSVKRERDREIGPSPQAFFTFHASRSACQFQERNHALLQFARRELQHVLQRLALATSNLPETHAAQRGEVRAAAEFLAQLVREAADVGALGAGDAELAERLLVVR